MLNDNPGHLVMIALRRSRRRLYVWWGRKRLKYWLLSQVPHVAVHFSYRRIYLKVGMDWNWGRHYYNWTGTHEARLGVFFASWRYYAKQ